MPTETNSLVVLGPLWPVQGAGLVAAFKHLVLMSDEISVKTVLSTRYTVTTGSPAMLPTTAKVQYTGTYGHGESITYCFVVSPCLQKISKAFTSVVCIVISVLKCMLLFLQLICLSRIIGQHVRPLRKYL